MSGRPPGSGWDLHEVAAAIGLGIAAVAAAGLVGIGYWLGRR